MKGKLAMANTMAVLISGDTAPRACGGSETWCLHRDGCRDLKSKKEASFVSRETGTVEALRSSFNDDMAEIVHSDYGLDADVMRGWRFDRDVHFHPCIASERLADVEAPAPVEVDEAVEAPAKPGCDCGCGQTPKGKNSRFLPGHDARFHSASKPKVAKVRKPARMVFMVSVVIDRDAYNAEYGESATADEIRAHVGGVVRSAAVSAFENIAAVTVE